MVNKPMELIKEQKGTTYVGDDDLAGIEEMGLKKAKGVLLQAFVNCQTEQLDEYKAIKANKAKAKSIRKQIAASAAGVKLKEVTGDITDSYDTIDKCATKMENIVDLAKKMGINTSRDFVFLAIEEDKN